jgi:hypothetical protein
MRCGNARPRLCTGTPKEAHQYPEPAGWIVLAGLLIWGGILLWGRRKGKKRGAKRYGQTASDSSLLSCAVSSIAAAATFSSRCATRDVPGIGSSIGERASSAAIAI